MNVVRNIIILLFFQSFGIVFSQDADLLTGHWLNSEKTVQIEVFKKGNIFYGRVAWMIEPNNPDGSPKLDIKNPNIKNRKRKKLGLVVMHNFIFNENNKKWTGGTIYDPTTGTTYKGYMWFESDTNTKLKMRGYAGFSIFGKTSEWTRVKKG